MAVDLREWRAFYQDMGWYEVEWFVGDESILTDGGTYVPSKECREISDGEYYALCIIHGTDAMYVE